MRIRLTMRTSKPATTAVMASCRSVPFSVFENCSSTASPRTSRSSVRRLFFCGFLVFLVGWWVRVRRVVRVSCNGRPRRGRLRSRRQVATWWCSCAVPARRGRAALRPRLRAHRWPWCLTCRQEFAFVRGTQLRLVWVLCSYSCVPGLSDPRGHILGGVVELCVVGVFGEDVGEESCSRAVVDAGFFCCPRRRGGGVCDQVLWLQLAIVFEFCEQPVEHVHVVSEDVDHGFSERVGMARKIVLSIGVGLNVAG